MEIGPDDLEVRRVSVPRFPYYVAYLGDDEAIVVLAIAHERRRPRYWIDRSSEILTAGRHASP